MMQLSQDSLVTVLLCSDLGLGPEMKKIYRPYSLAQWNKLADSILSSSLKKPSALLWTEKDALKRELYLNDEEADRIFALLKRGGNIAIEIEGLASKGIFVTARAEVSYPQILKDKLKKDSPPVLYYSGNLGLVEIDGVAIVGSRDVDEAGRLFTEKLAVKCVRDGLNIVSGGARGVDSVAERTALAEGGCVISVVPDGLGRKIKEKDIRNAVLDDRMLMMSAANPAAGFSVYGAMERNKYIYALATYAVAVSAKENSGGTWAGVTENLKKKYAPVYVRSGDSVPAGNKKLIELTESPLGPEIMENDNLSLKHWFQNHIPDKNVLYRDKSRQMDFYSLSTDKEKNRAVKVTESSSKNEDYCEDGFREGRHILDVYEIILPYMKQALIEPMNQEELSNILNVNKAQINEWLKRALDRGEIVKLKNPVRYALK